MGDALLLEQLLALKCTRKDPSAQLKMLPQHPQLWVTGTAQIETGSPGPSACTVMLWLAGVTDGDVNPAETPSCVIFVLGASEVLGMARLGFVCLPPSCPSFPRSSQDWRRGGCMPPHAHGAARTSRLPCSKAKSMLHASNPIICYLQAQGPSCKPCPPAHPGSTEDHRAMRSLLRRGARRGQGLPWASARHPHPQDGVL